MGRSVSNLFGTKGKDIPIPAVQQWFEYVENHLGIPRDAFFIPGLFGGVVEGGFTMNLVGDVAMAFTSQEWEKYDIFWNHVAPMLLGRMPLDLRAALRAKATESKDVADQGRLDVKRPANWQEMLNPVSDPSGNIKERATAVELFVDLLAPGSPLRQLGRYDLKVQSQRLEKQESEAAQQFNDLKNSLLNPRLTEQQRGEIRMELRDLSKEQQRIPSAPTAKDILSERSFTDLERSVLGGSQEAQAQSLIEYLKNSRATKTGMQQLESLIFTGQGRITSDTMKAYSQARKAFLETHK